MKFNVKNWKKVNDSPTHATFRNPHGHELKIAKAPLSAQMRGALDGLEAAPKPQAFAKGGMPSHIHQQNIPNFSKNIPHLADGGKYGPTVGGTLGYAGAPSQISAPVVQMPDDVQRQQVQTMVDESANQPTNTPNVPIPEPSFQPPAADAQAAARMKGKSPEDQADINTAAESMNGSKVDPRPGMAKGGKVCPTCGGDPIQQHLLPGDAIPNKIEKEVVGQARKSFDQGGSTDQPKTIGQMINYPGSQPSPQPSQPPVKNYADGTPDAPISSSATDSPEQITAEMPQPPADTRSPEQQALNSLYNQKVQQLSLTPGDPAEMERIKTQQFGPNGEPPANFNQTAAQAANAAYKNSQAAEVAQKQAATTQMQKANEIRASQGLDPIPVAADQLASMNPSQTDETQKPAQDIGAQAAQQPSTGPQPGDQSLQQMEGKGFSMPGGGGSQQPAPSAGMPTPPDEQGTPQTPSPEDTAQKLLMAKQMTYDAFMKERANTVAQMNEASPDTLGKMYSDRSLPGKLGMIAGLMLGGLSSGMTGKSNPVLDMYNQTINRELQAQQMNMTQKQNLLSNNLAMTGHIDDATKLAKVNFMDHQMHQLTQLAAKYPNNQNIQQNLQALGMMGAQSSANLMDSVAANVAWRHAAANIQDPVQKIQFNPMMTPEQKQAALKDYGTYQSMNNARNNILNAFDQVSHMTLAGTFSPNQRDALVEPGLAQAIKDSEGRITPQDTPMIRALMPAKTDVGKTRAIKRVQLAKFMSSKMNFPMLDLAGVNVGTPAIGGITPGAPKLPPGQ